MMIYLKKSKMFLLLSILLTLYGCEKKDLTELPPATQEGKNTFGCLINGKLFVPFTKTNTTVLAARTSAFLDSNGVERGGMIIWADRYTDSAGIEIAQGVTIQMDIPPYEGIVYSFDSDNPQAKARVSWSYSKNNLPFPAHKGCSYDWVNSRCKGTIVFTKLGNRIMAATFEFTLQLKDSKPNCPPEVVVSQGRFDVIYN
ncbi:hypothetical protein [Thermoflexibacter ruber]|uniref:Uncharacterized protein n=1 Tax=Thermoflexibacter ruber TaxID=1003 RepID=A0A1I2JN40_9BACT|nr:hypothetical protein [Thermoflexibacter ruber]SFF55548.1 hypothetical protein SAMN04488541_105611 [Thermoflexibacter ruber]